MICVGRKQVLKLITPYKPILALPGTRALFVVAFVA